MPRLIEVVEYNKDWPALYEKEANRLRLVFGTSLVAIHHTGSTSVPDLVAKPVIDILIEVTSDSVIPEYYSQMEELGYDCRGEQERGALFTRARLQDWPRGNTGDSRVSRLPARTPAGGAAVWRPEETFGAAVCLLNQRVTVRGSTGV